MQFIEAYDPWYWTLEHVRQAKRCRLNALFTSSRRERTRWTSLAQYHEACLRNLADNIIAQRVKEEGRNGNR